MKKQTNEKPLPGNAIRAMAGTLAPSCGKIARNEVVRVPQICDAGEARLLTRMDGRAQWMQVESDFPARAIINDDGEMIADTSEMDSVTKAALERAIAANEALPHKVPAQVEAEVAEIMGQAEGEKSGDAVVQNRDGDQVATSKRAGGKK